MFQFTHPGKGATLLFGGGVQCVEVSIHAPWEGCDQGRNRYTEEEAKVSIHAPWEGCDEIYQALKERLQEFQFTHPGKGATHRVRG